MHHGDDLVEHRTREASFGAQCTNHLANSMCRLNNFPCNEQATKPIALPSGSKIVKLFAENMHRTLGHQGYHLSSRVGLPAYSRHTYFAV